MPDSIHNGHRERIREQYISHGAEAFLDHQFLELLLTYAIPRRDTNELAHLLLERFGSLEGVVTAEIAQLMLVEGVGESAAVFLRMQGDLFRRLRIRRLTDARGQIRLASPVDAARYAVSQLSLHTYESVLAVCLNAKKTVQSCEKILGGSLAEAQIYPRNIAEVALLKRAHGILLIHNHPLRRSFPLAVGRRDDRVRPRRAREHRRAAVRPYHRRRRARVQFFHRSGNRLGRFGSAGVFASEFQAHQAQSGALLKVMEPY